MQAVRSGDARWLFVVVTCVVTCSGCKSALVFSAMFPVGGDGFQEMRGIDIFFSVLLICRLIVCVYAWVDIVARLIGQPGGEALVGVDFP